MYGFISFSLISLDCSLILIGTWSEICSLCFSHSTYIVLGSTLCVSTTSIFESLWFLYPFLVHTSDLYVFHPSLSSYFSAVSQALVSTLQFVSICTIIGCWYWSFRSLSYSFIYFHLAWLFMLAVYIAPIVMFYCLFSPALIIAATIFSLLNCLLAFCISSSSVAVIAVPFPDTMTWRLPYTLLFTLTLCRSLHVHIFYCSVQAVSVYSIICCSCDSFSNSSILCLCF